MTKNKLPELPENYKWVYKTTLIGGSPFVPDSVSAIVEIAVVFKPKWYTYGKRVNTDWIKIDPNTSGEVRWKAVEVRAKAMASNFEVC